MLVLSALLALFYNAWLLGYWFNPKIVRTEPISSLAVPGQPHWLFFIWTDIVASSLAVTIGIETYRRAKALSWSLFGFSLFTILAAVFTMTSTRVENYFLNWDDTLHLLFSTLSLLFMLAAIAFSLRQRSNLLLIVLTLIYLISMCLILLSQRAPDLGLMAQKVNSLVTGLWLLAASYYYLKNEKTS